MRKDKVTNFCGYIAKHCTVVFPIVLIVVVALTVSMALGANRVKGAETHEPSVTGTVAPQESRSQQESLVQEISEEIAATMAPEEVPLTENTNEEVYSLVVSYYNAMANGDTETLQTVFDSLSTADLLRFEETAKYLDGYGTCEVYLKRGLTENSALACVYYKVCFMNHPEEFPGYQMLYLCRDEDGRLYIKNENNFTEEENQYIDRVTEQDDVVEFYNRISVEYNELMLEKPELLEYLKELFEEIDKSVGEALAELGIAKAANMDGSDQNGQEDQSGEGSGAVGEPDGQGETGMTEQPVVSGPQYAVATTTVNVRSSDSEQADKLGSVNGGTRVEVQEVCVNGWTKIVYEKKDGYIKSEYLQMEESAAGQEVVGKVTANTNINVRSAASQSSERLGLLAAGGSLELLGVEGEWCKVVYNGQVAYVKAEFVTQE